MDELNKNFPVGLSDFNAVRKYDSLYVDKTEYIHRLIKSIGSSKYWFLARPRRFGKSLLVDTLNELFLGHKELFEGLNIHSQGYDFEPYPIVNLSLDSVSSHSASEMNSSLINQLEAKARVENIPVSDPNRSNKLPPLRPIDIFSNLLERLAEKHKKNVVVLIDEYDKPILDHLDNEVKVKEIRASLREFYGALKSKIKYLHFVFITGISKVAQTAIHSALNNLVDLTLDQEYAAICGYTKAEFLAAFSPYFDSTLKFLADNDEILENHTAEGLIQEIFDMYDGYSWDGRTRVLNPYSINNFFRTKELKSFWFMTGGPPTYLDQAIKMDPKAFLELTLTKFRESELVSASLGSANPIPTLFQTGYLTVGQKIPLTRGRRPSSESDDALPTSRSKKRGPLYTLKVPNQEVTEPYELALFQILSPSLSSKKDTEIEQIYQKIGNYLIKKDIILLENEFKSLLSSISYTSNTPNHSYYQAAFQIILKCLTFDVRPEVLSAEGRSDLEITLSDDLKVIIELKYIPNPNEDKKDADWIHKKLDQAVQAALTQIEEKNYARQYLGQYKVLKMGLAIYHRAEVKVGFGPDQEKNG
ncbi:MAG: ATP-binding protein [Deltaproteobacteria bacterium]|nr:ATP-binding protein [Deltaproteobacteria bacterium]